MTLDDYIKAFSASKNEAAQLWFFLIAFRAIRAGVTPAELITAFGLAWQSAQEPKPIQIEAKDDE